MADMYSKDRMDTTTTRTAASTHQLRGVEADALCGQKNRPEHLNAQCVAWDKEKGQ